MTDIQVDLSGSLGDFQLNVKFSAPSAAVTAIFGHSGSGKTSVLRAIAGLNKSLTGRIRVGNEVWQDERHFLPSHKRSIGYVFQEASLFPHLSVKRNLEYGWRRIRPDLRLLKFDDVVELLGIVPLLQRDTQQLSGGERQRVAIARALLTSPTLLLMDEPLSALDHEAKRSILPYLENLHDDFGIPTFYVSHDPHEVARLADHLVLLQKGRVIAEGPAANLLTQLDLPIASYDDASSLLEGVISAHDYDYHLTWVSMDCGRVAVSRENLRVGQHARVEIRARDVSLALSAHSDTSILNMLPAVVMDAKDINQTQVIVRLKLLDGQTLLSRITRRSAVALGVREGLLLYAQVKSVSLLNY